MKNKFVVIILFLSFNSYASDFVPNWVGWRIDAHGIGCGLIKDYYIPYKERPILQGFLAGTKFHRAHMRFTANTFTHGDLITEDELGVIKYRLQIESTTPHIKDNEKISKAVLGGYVSQPWTLPDDDYHIFSLSEKESLGLLQKFERNENVDFSLIFANGETRTFTVFSSGNFNGHVWVAMFKTCIKEHVRKRSYE